MKKFNKMYMILSIIILIIISIFYFRNESDKNKTEYLTTEVKIGNISNKVLSTGSINAYEKVSVGAQVSGQIKKLHVNIGDKVVKGQLIAEIDSTTQQNDLDTAISKLDIYNAQLKSKLITLNIAQNKYKRQNNLYKTNSGSKEDYENAQDALALAQSSVSELKANIKQAEIAVSTAKINLGYTKITSPLDGVIVSSPVKEGQTVNSMQTAPTIVEVAILDKVLIKAEISEGDITKVKSGLPVSFTIMSDPNKIYKTTLKSVDPGPTTLSDNSSVSSTSTNNSTSSAIYYYGNLVVDNKDNKLRIDMTTQVTIIVAEKKGILYIPKLAVKKENDTNYVYILENNQPVKKIITTGISDSINIEVISGLEKQQKIIVSSLNNNEIIDKNGANRPPRMGM
ncbi:TPA: efflux RND transporter periplasmic adaptor subunit [Escherichia coli]|nr:efflux RND transporter periplasmic adaptor subunit [Escherichia coli]